MIKKFLSLMLASFLCCCAETPDSFCPLVTISRNNARLIQKVNYQDDFDIELIGYEGYCFFDERIKREKASITPVFEVKRLRTYDETDVHFSWYTETVKGPPAYLGRKDYNIAVSLDTGQRSKRFRGPEVEVKIPTESMYEFEIQAGLVLSPEERKYNQRIFDIDFEYYDTHAIPDKPKITVKAYPETTYQSQTDETLHDNSPTYSATSCSSCN